MSNKAVVGLVGTNTSRDSLVPHPPAGMCCRLQLYVDCVGGELTANVVRCLGLGGRLLVCGTLANSPLTVPLRDLMMPGAAICGFLLANWLAAQPSLRLLDALREVRRLMVSGMFDTEVAETFGLDQVSDTFAAATRPGRTGKVMLSMSKP